MTNWLTPAGSSTSSSGTQPDTLASDTDPMIDPGLPAQGDLDLMAPPDLPDGMTAPPDHRADTQTAQFPVAGQTYPGDSYPGATHPADSHFASTTTGRMPVVASVLAASAVALIVAILLALLLQHDGIDNHDRLFPESNSATVVVAPTLNTDGELS